MRSSIEKNSAKEDVQNDFPCIRCVFLVQEFICLGHDRKFLMWTIVIFYVTKKSVHLVEKLACNLSRKIDQLKVEGRRQSPSQSASSLEVKYPFVIYFFIFYMILHYKCIYIKNILKKIHG
jgi:hypothetical protein